MSKIEEFRAQLKEVDREIERLEDLREMLLDRIEEESE